ncbi:twin-arginine translocation signal domain-containing protein [Bradyrhizobium sp. CCGB01]|uniref:twin-arginine translocation signal domain-containing protein n=1 Tax=Bradyrhizobium sp. CCGB01 TaxID=2949634 RepID=UPI0020B4414D|nr:twin-arginine translocation signal domain-containing protein [Bradyrhizobium sp. CCGB01]MCP3404062.1 twin-arginine translocation signal domain-containing protein [Bradyrhizobium sp. CCGB01]
MIFSRRQFLAQLAAAPVSAAIGSDLCASARNSNDSLTEVCVVAWNESKSPARTVDLWMARCGSIDVARLSDVLGRFVVWDEVTSERTEGQSIDKIKSAISHYFDVRIGDDESNLATLVGEFEDVPEALGSALARFRSRQPFSAGSTAIIDLSSCGVTRLQWRDLMPCIKQAYGKVVGIDYTDAHLSDADPAYYDAPYSTSQESWRTLTACDFWAIASDSSLSHQPNLCFEARAALSTEALNELAQQIALSPDVEAGFLQATQKHFLGYGSGLENFRS